MDDILTIGNKASFISKVPKEANHKEYVSKIEDITEENIIKMLMPMEGAKMVLLALHKVYLVQFYTKFGIYQAEGKIVARYKEGQLYFVDVQLVSSLRKYQRRKYFRCACLLQMKFREMEEDEEKLSLKQKYTLPWFKGTVLDLSGGGARIVTERNLNQGSIIILKLALEFRNRTREYNLMGYIISSEKVKEKEGIYQQRVEFRKVENTQREEIIRFTFERERLNKQIDKKNK